MNALYDLGEELFEVSKKRNQAAHGSTVLPAQALKDSKDCVYNTSGSQKSGNTLVRLVKLMS